MPACLSFRSPDGNHKFIVGGRRYEFCAYCNMSEKQVKESTPVEEIVETAPNSTTPPQIAPDRETDFWGWVDFHKDEIRADYFGMTNKDFQKEWQFSNGVKLTELRKRLSLFKGRGKHSKQETKPGTKRPKNSDSSTRLSGIEKETVHPGQPGHVENALQDIQKQLKLIAPLPIFNEAWPPEVKIKWLDVYSNIIMGKEVKQNDNADSDRKEKGG